MGRISDLILRKGDALAQAQLGSGQAWGGAVQQIGQIPGQVMGRMADIKQEDQIRQARAQQLERGRMELASAKAGQVAQSGAERAVALIKSGNTEEVLATLDPAARRLAEGWLADDAKNEAERTALTQKDLKGRARFLRAVGYDPAITEVMFGLLAEKYPESQEIWAQVKGDPVKQKAVIDAYADFGEDQTTPNLMQTDPEKDLIDPKTGAIVRKGTPKPIEPAKLTLGQPVPAMVNGRRVLIRAGSDGLTYDMANRPVTGAVSPDVPPRETAAEPLVPIIGKDGQPVLVRRSQAEGQRPASNREQGRPVTSGDAGRLAELDTSIDDLTVLGAAVSAAGDTGTVAKAGAVMPNWVTDLTGWGTDAKKKQALIDRVKQVIGKALEGGVLRKEDEIKYEKILPTIGDVNAVVVSKLAGIDSAIRKRRERTVESLTDAGYDTSRFARTEATSGGDINMGNAGVTVTAPNGKTYSYKTQADADKAVAAAKAAGLWK